MSNGRFALPALLRGRLRVSLAIGLVVCVCVAATAEVLVRHAIDGRIASAARKHFTGPVTVGIGATPALLDAVTGTIHRVTIQAPSDTVCHLHDIAATATLAGLHRTNGGAAVAGSSAGITLTTRTFTDLLGGRGTATVTPDPAAGDLRIGLGPGSILQVAETARLHGDTLQLSPARVSLMGRPVSPAMRDTISAKLTIQRKMSALPLNLVPRSAAVTSDGVQVRFAGGPAALATTGTSAASRCGGASSRQATQP